MTSTITLNCRVPCLNLTEETFDPRVHRAVPISLRDRVNRFKHAPTIACYNSTCTSVAVVSTFTFNPTPLPDAGAFTWPSVADARIPAAPSTVGAVPV